MKSCKKFVTVAVVVAFALSGKAWCEARADMGEKEFAAAERRIAPCGSNLTGVMSLANVVRKMAPKSVNVAERSGGSNQHVQNAHR